MKQIAILGVGAFGIALALAIARSGCSVFLLTRDQQKASFMEKNRHHPSIFPEHVLPKNIIITTNFACLKDVCAVFLTMPSQHVRYSAKKILPYRPSLVVVCSKGLEKKTGNFLSNVVKEENPLSQVCTFSGPGFATEIVENKPTVQVLASLIALPHVVELFDKSKVLVQTTHDTIGAQIGGVMKNIIAIGCGLLKGLGGGSNAHAILVMRGFQEMLDLAHALGAKKETLLGPTGLGDLILTCSHATSRNFSFGFHLGRGGFLTDKTHKTVEGVENISAVMTLMRKHRIQALVCQSVDEVLKKMIIPKVFLDRLLRYQYLV